MTAGGAATAIGATAMAVGGGAGLSLAQSYHDFHGFGGGMGGMALTWIGPLLALLFVMGETHEIVHTAVGRLLCGCWGPRDFNVWSLCEGCSEEVSLSILATIVGPVFTFGVIWWGFVLLRSSASPDQKSLGFALVFANLPAGRIVTAAMGGGDEVYSLRQIFVGGAESIPLWILGVTIVVALSAPPLYRAFKVLVSRWRWATFVGFLIVPFVLYLVVVLGLMNTLLTRGLLDQNGVIGSPILVNVWTVFWVVVLGATWTQLYDLLTPASETVSSSA